MSNNGGPLPPRTVWIVAPEVATLRVSKPGKRGAACTGACASAVSRVSRDTASAAAPPPAAASVVIRNSRRSTIAQTSDFRLQTSNFKLQTSYFPPVDVLRAGLVTGSATQAKLAASSE